MRARPVAVGAVLLGLALGGGGVAVANGEGGGPDPDELHHPPHHDTRTDLEVTEHRTRVVAQLDGVTVFDATAPGMPDSPAAAELVTAAGAAITAAGGVAGPPGDAGTTSQTVDEHLGDEVSTEVSVTTSLAIGPGTILIGEDQSETFFVEAGTTNVNTNTHTETFVHQTFRHTTTITHTLVVTGTTSDTPETPETPATPGTPDTPGTPGTGGPPETGSGDSTPVGAAPAAAAAATTVPRFTG